MSAQHYRGVIGVAGHVDHGKTTLIKALTGITTARAHEQAIGMTQDLGFAHFADAAGNPVGVIDVPGHERYIRNMVAGMWSLDLVLLVVAADEGWMPMTRDHLQVIRAMGIERLVVAINKCDLVCADELKKREEQIQEQVFELVGLLPEVVSVSALTGLHIDALRELLLTSLPKQAADQEQGARLYIDRVFSAHGTGTVVTGTLRGGTLRVGDKLTLYPSGRSVQIRSLQAYHQPHDEVSASSRVAVGLKKVPHQEVSRGDCLASDEAHCLAASQLVVRLEGPSPTRQQQVEVAVGTWQGRATLVPLAAPGLVRLLPERPLPCFFAQPLAIIRHGSSELLHAGRVAWSGEVPTHQRRALYSLLSSLPADLSGCHPARLQLALQGYVESSALPAIPAGMVQGGRWLIEPDWLAHQQQAVLTLLAEPGSALSQRELSWRLHVESDVMGVLLKGLKEAQKIRLNYEKWQLGDGESEDDLSAPAQAVLALVRSQNKAGYEPGKTGPGGVSEDTGDQMGLSLPERQKQLRNLARLKYVVLLEGGIYLDAGLYREMVCAVLADQQVGALISMAHVKDQAGLSRKYAIPFCLRMEMDGWVRRQDNDRIVLKLPA